MPSPRTDRALRRLIAEMACLDVDDVAAIVAELDSQQRERVLSLIAAYRDPSAGSLSIAGEMPASAGLSPWLTTRLAAAIGVDHALTSTAHGALKSALGQGSRDLPEGQGRPRRSSAETLLGHRGRP